MKLSIKNELILAALVGGLATVSIFAFIADHFSTQIISFEAPRVFQKIAEGPTNGNPYLGLMGMFANPMSYQSNGSPSTGAWPIRYKEFTVNCNQTNAIYDLFIADQLTGNGGGVVVGKMTFYNGSGQACTSGGAATLSIQSNDTTATTFLASTVYTSLTQGKNQTNYAGFSYLANGVKVQYTIGTAAGNAGSMIVGVWYGGATGEDICAGSASSC